MDKLPQMGVSKKIGQKAERALKARAPDNWADVDQSGDYDFGIDAVVTVDTDLGMGFSFFLQLKGIDNPNDNGTGTIDRTLKLKTLNFYRLQAPEVMIAVVDLSNYEQSREGCPIYYKWLDEEFFEEIERKPSTQKEMVVKVEMSNVLDKHLDVIPFLKQRTTMIIGAKNLAKSIENAGADPISAISDFNKAIPNKPQLIETISLNTNSDVPWVVTPENQFSEILKNSQNLIKTGLLPKAREILEGLLVEKAQLSEHEQAELLSQLATTSSANGDFTEALNYRQEASGLTVLVKYDLEYFDSIFTVDEDPESDLLEDIVKKISGTTIRERMVKAKCLALLGRVQEALDLFSESETSEQLRRLWVSRMVLDDDLFEVSNRAIDPLTLNNDDDKFLYYLICGSKLYHQAINDYENIGDDAPVHGRLGYDMDDLSECLELFDKGWEAAERLCYPSNILSILEESFHVYSILGCVERLRKHLLNMLYQSPKCLPVLRTLIRLESNATNPKKSLAYIDQLGDKLEPEQVSVAVYDNYRLAEYKQALEWTLNHMGLLLNCPSEIASKTLGLGLICALSRMDQTAESIIREKLEVFNESNIVIAISEYFYQLESNPKNKKQLDENLWCVYEELERPVSIAEQLLRTIPVNEKPERIINLASRVLEFRELSSSEYKLYCDALIQVEQWGQVALIADKFLARNVDLEVWSVIKALGLENQGDLAGALSYLESYLDQGAKSEAISNNAASLNFMLGRTEKAEELLLDIYSGEGNIQKKINALKSLIFIYSNNPDSEKKLNTAIINFGNLINRDDEIDEGQFLMFCITLYKGEDDQVRTEIQSRLQSYTVNFPNSKILRTAYLPVDGGAEDILASLERAAGITNQQKEQWEKNRLQVASGSLPIPFSMLHRFLSDSNNVYSSWAILKSMNDSCPEYNLKHTPYNMDRIFTKDTTWMSEVFFDEVSLIMLADLGLLSHVLDETNQVYILTSVFQDLQRNSHAFFGGVQAAIASQIYSLLNRHSEKLRLLKSSSDNFFKDYPNKSVYEDVVWICDDFNLAALVDIELNQDSLPKANVFNVIACFTNSNILSIEESIDKTEMLLELNTGSAGITPVMVSQIFLKYVNQNKETFIHGRFRRSLEALINPATLDFHSTYDLVSKMFSYIHRATDIDIDRSQLKEFLDYFALKFPVIDISEHYALWFVSSCFLLNPVYEYEVLKQSLKHKKLWDLYSEVFRLHFGEQAAEVMFEPIIDCIFKDTSNDKSFTHDRINAAFMPGLPESDLFQALYQKRSLIEHENNS
jgi:hypothetical protein